MKVIVFGATGRVGRAVALTLLTAGYEVTAFARDATKLPAHKGIAAIVGDAANAVEVANAMVGQDAVVVSLGDTRNPFALALGARRITPMNICEIGTANVIAAAEAASVRRLVCVSSYGVGDTRAMLPPLHKMIFRWLRLGEQMADKEKQDQLVKLSSLDWTLVQPVGLTDGAATGRWLASSSGERRKRTISRIDLAAFIVEILSGASNKHETVVLSGLTVSNKTLDDRASWSFNRVPLRLTAITRMSPVRASAQIAKK